jgi:hypothetical protein
MLDHAASNQFGKVDPGDILWFVTYEHGTLYLIGRMQVEQIVSQTKAERMMGERLWEATYHVIPKKGTESLVSSIDFMEVAPVLRFASGIHRLPPDFTAQSVRRMRLLTTESAGILEALWHATVLTPSENGGDGKEELSIDIAEKPRAGGQGFSVTPEVRRAIESYAMQRATQFFMEKGYDVKDTSRGNPFDLFCTNGTDELFVEVKGTRTRGETVMLTKNEVGFARKNRERMVLFILHSLHVTSDGGIRINGGEYEVFHPWDVDRGTLIATQYLYTPNE